MREWCVRGGRINTCFVKVEELKSLILTLSSRQPDMEFGLWLNPRETGQLIEEEQDINERLSVCEYVCVRDGKGCRQVWCKV